MIRNIKKISVLTFILLLTTMVSSCQEGPELPAYIKGDWKYVRHLTWSATEYGPKQVNTVKASVLHVENNRIYFTGPASKLIESCTFSKSQVGTFFDREEKDPEVFEDRSMAIAYTKEQLATFRRIELNCAEDNCLGTVYYRQDTLVLNYCGGITFYFRK